MSSSIRPAATLLAILGVWAGPRGAAAAPPRAGTAASASPSVVAVVNAADDQVAGARAARDLTRTLLTNPRLTTVVSRALVGALEAPLTPAAPVDDTELDAHLSAADDAIAQFDYDKALIQLFRAERLLIDRNPDADTRQHLADVNFRLGLIYLAQGDADRARAAFGVVHALQPGTELDPARYTPEVVGAFERARPGASDSTLSVSVSEPDAAVFVDGRPAAVAPAEIEVPAGVHYVLVKVPEHRLAGRRVVTQPGSVEPVRIAVGPLPAELRIRAWRWRLQKRKRQTRPDVEHAAERIRELTSADSVVLLLTRKQGIVAVAVGDRGVSRAYAIPGEGATLANAIAPPPLDIAVSPPETPLYRRPWFIAALGGTGVALATAIAVTVLTSGDSTRPSGGLCFPPDC